MSPNHASNWVQLQSFQLIQRITGGADGTVYFGGINNGVQVIQKITSTNWNNPADCVFTNLHTAYTSGIGDDGNAIVCLTVLRNGNLVAGDFDGYTRISANQGASFTTLPDAYVPGSVVPKWAASNAVWRPNSLTQDVNASNTWYGGGGYGPMRTDDGGQTWQYICAGIGEVVTYKISFNPTDPNRIYIPCADQCRRHRYRRRNYRQSRLNGYTFFSMAQRHCHVFASRHGLLHQRRQPGHLSRRL